MAAQMTIRTDEDLIRMIKAEAEAEGRSMNEWVVHVLRIAVDPEHATTKHERLVARLRAAGLLHEFDPNRPLPRRPSGEELAKIRRDVAARGGTPLSKIIEMDRGQ